MVSSYNSRLTCSSSRRPRIANGRIYGLAAEKGWGRLMCKVAPLTSEVSRAKDMARLKTRRVS